MSNEPAVFLYIEEAAANFSHGSFLTKKADLVLTSPTTFFGGAVFAIDLNTSGNPEAIVSAPNERVNGSSAPPSGYVFVYKYDLGTDKLEPYYSIGSIGQEGDLVRGKTVFYHQYHDAITYHVSARR